jgi:murein tripeptide amidase MpaA
MKSVSLLSALALVSAAPSLGPFEGHKVFRFQVETHDQYLALENVVKVNNLDLWSSLRVGFVDIRIPPIMLAAGGVVRESLTIGIKAEVLISNVQTLLDAEIDHSNQVKRLAASPINNATALFSDYQDAVTYVDYLVGLPNAEKFSIGTTFSGASIDGATFGTGPKSIVLNGAMHAREWISPAVLTYVADWLLSSDSQAVKFRELYTFYIIPVLNVDGYAYTRISSKNRMWRKNREPTKGSPCIGTDPNRNFDQSWGKPGASGSACSDTFYGPSASSSKEAAALSNFVEGLGNVVSYFDLHAYSQQWMFAWGYTCNEKTKDFNDLNKASASAVAAVKAVNGISFAAGQICNTIYQASGTSVDFMYSKGVKYAATIELRGNSCYLF